MGPSGSGKSALAAALSGAGEITSGSVEGILSKAGAVSLETEAALIERERLRDDSDITDKVNDGTPVREMLEEDGHEIVAEARNGDEPHLDPLEDQVGAQEVGAGGDPQRHDRRRVQLHRP